MSTVSSNFQTLMKLQFSLYFLYELVMSLKIVWPSTVETCYNGNQWAKKIWPY